jgi:hypothetical protein
LFKPYPDPDAGQFSVRHTNSAGMCNYQASEIKLIKKIHNLDPIVNISFLNFQKFLVTAFALHDDVMLKGVDTVFEQTENEFVSIF